MNIAKVECHEQIKAVRDRVSTVGKCFLTQNKNLLWLQSSDEPRNSPAMIAGIGNEDCESVIDKQDGVVDEIPGHVS
jgi:hypothetical protein